MFNIDDFTEIYLDKDDVALIDKIGETTTRYIYTDNEHRNYFLYDGERHYFSINMTTDN